jgi:hypothetical protein
LSQLTSPFSPLHHEVGVDLSAHKHAPKTLLSSAHSLQ